MVPSLRGRLVCFYCGCRSAQTRRPNISRWQCEKCEAVNHLDENGDITDPPAAEIFSNTRYAQSIQRPTAPVFDVPDESLFCKTCLKNQHILSQSLASYFPSPDAPNHADYEKQYPKFRKELEERYPQVCEDCEPRVRERIRATGYAAKTDHLRRMMERTRGGYIPRGESGWKSLLVFIGGVMWALSMAGQIAWDVIALLSPKQDYGELFDPDASLSASECMHQVMRGLSLPSGCNTLVDPVARIALLLGVLSLWWNPRLQDRLGRPGGKIVGVAEYCKLQAILLLARCLGWIYLAGTANAEHDSQTTKGIHAALLFFGILSTVMSFRAISIDYSPKVVFQDSPEPLIPRSRLEGLNTGPKGPNSITHQPSPHLAQRSSNTRPFSINDLAPASASASASAQQYPNYYQSPYQPPTPPPDEDDDGAMDWTPSQQAILRPATLYRPTPPAAQQTQQTPFRGHLPADVVSMEHRLRNPPNKPTFRKASVSTKQNFFKTPKRDNHRDYDYASDTATEYEPSLAETVTPAATRFADPRLRLQPGQHEDTGLERLLANAFSLDDEPQEVREIKHREVQDVPGDCQSNEYTFTQWHRLPVLILLVASYFFWTMTLKPSLAIYEVQFRLVTPFIAGLASIRSLVLMLRKDSTEWSGSDIVVFAAELMASIFLAQAVRQPPIGSFLSANHGSIETFGSIFIAVMAVQELWMLSLDLHLAWKNENSLEISTPTPASSAKPPSFGQQQPVNGEETQKSTIAPDRTSRAPPMPVSRSTRSRTKEKNTNSRNGFGGLSLGGVEQSKGLDGMGSLSLGQPRRRDRGGMW